MSNLPMGCTEADIDRAFGGDYDDYEAEMTDAEIQEAYLESLEEGQGIDYRMMAPLGPRCESQGERLARERFEEDERRAIEDAWYPTPAAVAVAARLRAFSDPELLAAVADPEYQTRIDGARVTWEMRSKSPRRVDGGRRSIEDSPLFGGPRQGDMFGEVA